eukprot:Opistho-2@63831
MTRVAFLAKGTLGDIRPCVAVAVRLSRALGQSAHHDDGPQSALVGLTDSAVPINSELHAGPSVSSERLHTDVTVVFATHGHFRNSLHSQLQQNGIQFRSIDDDAAPASDASSEDAGRMTKRRRLATDTGHQRASSTDSRLCMDEALRCLDACSGAHLIVFNLFACEGVSIAEKLGARCAAISPFAVTRPPPPGFARMLKEEHADLCAALLSSPLTRSDSTAVDAADGLNACDGMRITMADVDCWLWRVFLDDHGDFRECIGLDPCPFRALMRADVSKHTTSNGRCDLPNGISSEGIVHRQQATCSGAWDSCAQIPLLYGISPHVMPRPAFWPSSVKLCGYFVAEEYSDTSFCTHHTVDGTHNEGVRCEPRAAANGDNPGAELHTVDTLPTLPGDGCAVHGSPPAVLPLGVTTGANNAAGVQAQGRESASSELPSDLEGFIAAHAGRVLLVTFGSMETIGVTDKNAAVFSECFVDALASLDMCAVVQSMGMIASCISARVERADRVFILRTFLPHERLIPLCAGVVHHGGAGTVATCLRCGIPQLVFPCMFDQREWAERVEWLGVGIAGTAYARVAGRADVCAPLRRLVRECGPLREKARHVALSLKAEDGVGVAVQAIVALMIGCHGV